MMGSLAVDNGYDSKVFRKKPRSEGVRPLIMHHFYNPIDHALNARLNDNLYKLRSLSETVNSSIKRSISEFVSSRTWFRQFREIVPIALVHTVKRAISPENNCRGGIQ